MKELLKYFKNYKVKAILAPVFKMLEACFELLVPLVMASIIDVGIKNDDKPYVIKMAVVMILLGVIGLVCAITAQYFSAKTAMGFGKELRYDLFKHIETFSYSELDEIGGSTLITRMTSDINQIQTGVNMFLRLFMRSPFIVFGAMIMAFTVDAKAARVFLITLPVLFLIVFGIMLITIPMYKNVQNKLDKVTRDTRENLSGVRVIRAFNQQSREKKIFCEDTNKLTGGQLAVGKVSSFLNPLTYAVVNLSIVALIWNGALQVDIGGMKQGEVYALVNYMSQILIELVKLANLIILETKAVACGNRISQIFEIKCSQEYKENGVQDIEYDTCPKVEFRDVALTYKNAKETSVEHVSFTANSGDVIGIIGGTGSGKSTLVNMIPRLYDCTEGTVRIDGVDVKDYDRESLNKKIGIVPQKAVLFSGTIKENICWGKEDAGPEEIDRALSIAQAKDFVYEKPDNINFYINQGAKNLSGGQKQRLTIARALVKNPEILILDDSSSALDYATDAALRMAIKEKTRNMTVFIVSQRSSSIMHADKIIVLDDGKVVGMGKHEELLRDCQVYREICNSQLNQDEEGGVA